MKIQIDNIVKQMSPDVLRLAEEEAKTRGVSLDQFVEDQLIVQLSDDEFSMGASKIRADGWDGRVDGGRGGVRGGIGIRGRF